MMLLKLEILKFLKNNFVYLGLTLFQIAESFFISILTDFLGVTYRETEKDLRRNFSEGPVLVCCLVDGFERRRFSWP